MTETLAPTRRSRTASNPAAQQPPWPDHLRVAQVRDELAARPALVGDRDVAALRRLLARAFHGEYSLVQAGDCAEDPAECTVSSLAPKVEMLDLLAEVMGSATGAPVLRVGRLGGQFAKPRSADTERCGDQVLPVFRGALVNAVDPLTSARVPDPGRMLTCHDAARSVLEGIGFLGRGAAEDPAHAVWASHEALVLDYEEPQLRPTRDGGVYLASTHLPWIGERTRQLDGAHVRMLAEVANPVGCKVGPDVTPAELLTLCSVLDPHRDPGRLLLVPRFGAGRIPELEPLVRAVTEAGHPVLWVCDPMHGNTVRARDGLKTRRLDDIMTEVRGFLGAVARGGGVAAGLHLETSAADIVECEGAGSTAVAGPRYRSLCDPRLNRTQSVAAAAHWRSSPEAVVAG